MKVPFLDLGRLHASIRPELDDAWNRVVRSSRFIGGEEIEAFEAEFAAAHSAARAVGCSSGTDALILAFAALGIGTGDEVIVPSMTFVATAEAVVLAGATPVLADVNAQTLLLDEDSVAAVRTNRTRAVVPVHLYGSVVPLESLDRWRNDGLLVIADGAQAHLATWRDRPIASAADATTFSFFPGKNLGALGDAGAVVTDNRDLARQIARLRDHGRTTKYEHDVIGYNARIDALQAALLRVKLRHLPRWTDGRRHLADHYRSLLPAGSLVPWEEGAVHHLLVARVSAERDHVLAALVREGIGVGVHYPVPLSKQPSLGTQRRPTPRAESASREVLSLPMDPLMDVADIDDVCETLVDALAVRSP